MSRRQNFSYNTAIGVASVTNGHVTPFGVQTLRLASTADCYVVFGVAPVATVATGMLVRASTAGEDFSVYPGEGVACISGTAGGTLNITEIV